MKTSKLFSISLVLLSFALPLFFLPVSADFYFLNKITLLYVFTAGLLIAWAVEAFVKREFFYTKGVFNKPVIALAVAFLLSTLIQSPNKWLAFSSQTGIVLASTLIYFLVINKIKKRKVVDWVLTGVILSSVVLAWIAVFAYLGVFSSFGPSWLQQKSWTPTGSLFNSLSLMVVLFPATLFWAFKSKGATEKVLLFIASSLQILASVLMLTAFINKEAAFVYLLPKYGWQICVEGFKALETALFGVGPNNFISAFNRFRPIGLNNTTNWTVKFGSNSNEYFNLLSTTGLVGTIIYLWLIARVLRKENWQGTVIKKVLYIMLATSFIVQLFIPANILLRFLTFLLLALVVIASRSEKEDEIDRPVFTKVTSEPTIYALTSLALLSGIAIVYLQSRVWRADYFFRQSLVAAQENRGIETYNLQIKAIGLNPYGENYRLSYANTNFALANSLSAQSDLSDQNKANINQLVSQSIREAKSLISLNPNNSGYWINLAQLYRNIINVAEGSEQWAVASYLEAVRTDPTNPLLRIDLGGLFFALKDIERAIEQFRIATNLKPDYANAYYNLATAYKTQEEWKKAFINMQAVVNLIPEDSPDRQKVLDELEELKAKLPAPPQQQQPAAELREEERIQQPEPLPTPRPGFEQVELSEEEAPPEIPEEEVAEESPEPEESPKPEKSPEAQPPLP